MNGAERHLTHDILISHASYKSLEPIVFGVLRKRKGERRKPYRRAPSLWQPQFQLADLGPGFLPTLSFLLCAVELRVLTHGPIRRVMKISHAKCPSQDRCGLSLSSTDIMGDRRAILGAERAKESGYGNLDRFLFTFYTFP